MKTIGVLGGIGPQATMDFEARVHRVSQRLIPPQQNRGYPGMVVHYCRHAPAMMTEQGRPKQPLEVDPRLIDAARWLGAMTDFLVIPSNFTYLFREAIEAAAGIPVLNMIDLVLAEVKRRDWRNVGVLGYGLPTVYLDPLTAAGLKQETIGPEQRLELDVAIMAVMEGRANDASRAITAASVNALRSRGVDGIILGCTEVPLLIEPAEDLINPAELLAEAAVRKAID